MRLYSTANERGLTSQPPFLFAYRQSAGGTPAIRWSVIQFKNDPQITQIKKDYFKFEIKIFNSEFRIPN
jgi:hypothetical protein